MVDPSSSALRGARAGVLARSAVTGAALRAALTEVADDWLRNRIGDATDVALVAVGGYGRQEPAPGSDFDLILLHRSGVDVSELADSLWYPIWDAGVGLDHSVRTVDEAFAVAGEDLKAVLGMLDARHVAGDRALSGELHSRVFERWRRDARNRLPELVAVLGDRLQRFGELAFLLEPELKEARGGTRDVNAMTAIASAQVADPPDERVRAAHRWLLDVRGELHRRALRGDGRSSRTSDRLVAQEQPPVAKALGVADADELMRRVSEAGRAIAFAADEACRRAVAAAAPSRRWSRRSGPVRRPLADGVVEQDGEVQLARDASPAEDPGLVLRVAAAAAQADLPIAAHTLRRLATQSAPLPEPWPASARDALVAALGAGRSAVAVFEALDQAGLLVALIPEWANVRCKPQHNALHRFTVDRHLIEAGVEAAALTRRVGRPDLLLLGALLHDIGKGFPGDHTDAGVAVVPQIAARLGLPPHDIDVLVSLVRHHLLLPDTATRRDLNDPATVTCVVDAVGDRATLELLHALTEADAVATGPAAWGEWKAELVADLVSRAAASLAGEPIAPADPLDAGQLALAERAELAVELIGSRVTIVAPDRPGLLWRWAGVLALHRLEIRSAAATSVGTELGPVAVTVFEVAPRFGSLPDVEVIRPDVRRAFDDALPLSTALAAREQMYADARPGAVVPARVLWVDDASQDASVVEVRAHDALGLLYRLTRVLADAGLDVRSARINTLGAEVVDAFYLLGADGAPVDDPARREQIETLLLAACGAGQG
ncbi:MAG TPA: [protein-PII] uridylyltransferase [Mycobacteriales bacterium]|nr:[protein-PII] uridylyltransferase [Mycobacteriales bacterium]